MITDKKNIEVEWTGEYPTLCFGTWEIKIDGKILKALPNSPEEKLLQGNMDTENTYESWYFDNWHEVWEDYDDGNSFKDWLKSNEGLGIIKLLDLNSIQLNKYEMKDLFTKIQQNDWRHQSCGGCI